MECSGVLIMCGFLFATYQIDEEHIEKSEKYVKRRGPDLKEVLVDTDIQCTYVHYLLHITGELTAQPIEKDGARLLYNGEIYNHDTFGNFTSDGHSILEVYLKEGAAGIKKLDGEFSGLIHDTRNNSLVIFRDAFGTKPIFIAKDERGIAISSYCSQLKILGFDNPQKIPVNHIIKLNLQTNKYESFRYRKFDLNQHKKDYSDWKRAFYKSIEKRTKNKKVKYFIGLSSGYDSGLISCVLNDMEVDYNSYSILAAENPNVMRDRVALTPHNTFFHLTEEQYLNHKRYLEDNCETFETPPRRTRINGYSVLKDKGAVGTGIICQRAKEDGCKVYISGQGSDEIISDYGFNGRTALGFLHSTIAGYFPDNLSSIFPWENFFGGTQEEFIAKDELVGGTFGLETRYPFLDCDLVQEFLWLHQDLKNRCYKAPIDYLLKELNYPMSREGLFSKVGFRANSGFKAKR